MEKSAYGEIPQMQACLACTYMYVGKPQSCSFNTLPRWLNWQSIHCDSCVFSLSFKQFNCATNCYRAYIMCEWPVPNPAVYYNWPMVFGQFDEDDGKSPIFQAVETDLRTIGRPTKQSHYPEKTWPFSCHIMFALHLPYSSHCSAKTLVSLTIYWNTCRPMCTCKFQWISFA